MPHGPKIYTYGQQAVKRAAAEAQAIATLRAEVKNEFIGTINTILQNAYADHPLSFEHLKCSEESITKKNLKEHSRQKTITVKRKQWHDHNGHKVAEHIYDPRTFADDKGALQLFDKNGAVTAEIEMDTLVSGSSHWVETPTFIRKIRYFSAPEAVAIELPPGRAEQRLRSQNRRDERGFKTALQKGEDPASALQHFEHLSHGRDLHAQPAKIALSGRLLSEGQYRTPSLHSERNVLSARLEKLTTEHPDSSTTITAYNDNGGKHQVTHYDKHGRGKRTTYNDEGEVEKEEQLTGRKKRTSELARETRELKGQRTGRRWKSYKDKLATETIDRELRDGDLER